jgi:hypothetical protein
LLQFKAYFERPKHLHQTIFLTLKPFFETAYYSENVIKFAFKKRKKGQNVYTFLATIFRKNSSGLLKSSPIGEILPNLVTLVATKFNFIVLPKNSSIYNWI